MCCFVCVCVCVIFLAAAESKKAGNTEKEAKERKKAEAAKKSASEHQSELTKKSQKSYFFAIGIQKANGRPLLLSAPGRAPG